VTTRVDPGRLSEAVRWAVSGAVFFGPVVQVFGVLLFGEVWSWWEVAARSALYAVGVALFLVVAVRFSAGARERVDVGRAVSTGVLPEGAAAEWRERLTVERRRLHSNRTAVPGLSGLAAVLVVVATLLPDGPGGGGWLLAVGLALAGALLTVRERRRSETVDGLRAQLPEGATSGGESAHVGDHSPSA